MTNKEQNEQEKQRVMPTGRNTRALLGYSNQVHHVQAKFNVEIDDVLNPGWWANIARDLTAGDEVRVTREDDAWAIWLYVKAIQQFKVRVIEINRLILDPEARPEINIDNHTIAWRGGAKWCVLDENGEVVSKGHEDKERAMTALSNRVKALAA